MSYNAAPRKKFPLGKVYADIGDEPMKRAIRISILMLGLVGTYVAAAVQQVPAFDGGPILVCPPKQTNCQMNLPPQ